jgi:hypothetical protein
VIRRRDELPGPAPELAIARFGRESGNCGGWSGTAVLTGRPYVAHRRRGVVDQLEVGFGEQSGRIVRLKSTFTRNYRLLSGAHMAQVPVNPGGPVPHGDLSSPDVGAVEAQLGPNDPCPTRGWWLSSTAGRASVHILSRAVRCHLSYLSRSMVLSCPLS